MNKAIMASGLQALLSGPGPFTVFAPSDLAFGNLGQGVLAELLLPKNKLKLADILSCHIVLGNLGFASFKDGEKILTIQGKELSVQVALGTVTIGGATIQNGDITSSNGVTHLLNKVLMN
jgi:uncharacterized surface protein with fasciclin (FAS1) repeats